MSAFPLEQRSRVATSAQYFFWAHPEWWAAGLCGLAWAVMLRHMGEMAAHGMRHRMSFLQELAYWMWMIAAMMLPLDLNAVRLTATRSLWRRRHRAMAEFILGYHAPWLPLGVVVAVVRQGTWTHRPAAVVACFAAAALWQWTPMHRRALAACHRTRPLAPSGWRADWDCLRFGGSIGVACVWSCWPIMLACAFAGHSLVAMTCGVAIGFVERKAFAPRPRAIMAATLVLAGYYAVIALL